MIDKLDKLMSGRFGSAVLILIIVIIDGVVW